MKSGKDERKPMDPLFPRLHIDDADIGGPKPPPRNKMALCEPYNVHCQRQSFDVGSMATSPLPPAIGRSSFVPGPSSNHVGSRKQQVRPTFLISPGSSPSTEKCHSYSSKGLNLNSPATNPDPRVLGRPTNYQNPFVSENLTKSPECDAVSSCTNCCSKRTGNENNFRIPSETTRNQDRDCSGPKERSRNESKDLAENICKFPRETEVHVGRYAVASSVPCISLAGNKIDTEPLKPFNSQQKCTLMDKKRKLDDPDPGLRLECGINVDGLIERLKRKRSPSALSHSVQPLGENALAIKRWSEDEACGPMQLENAMKEKQESSTTDSVPDMDLSPADIIGVIGPRLFWNARKTILHQQRLFAVQIFELHRLIKVQKLIARSPEVLHDKNINLNIPSIKFPPINNNNLLYEIPLNPSSLTKKPKVNTPRSNNVVDRNKADSVCGKIVPSLKCCDKDHPPHHRSSPKSSSTPASILTDPKLKPCCFHPPPGNQWLIPVRSPSEGLIYKPFTGPCPPSVSILAPVGYGNCSPINISSNIRTPFCAAAPNPHGIGHFSGPTVQSYFQPFPMPLTSPNLEVEAMTPHFRGSETRSSIIDVNFSVPCQCSGNFRGKSGEIVPSDCGRDSDRSKDNEMQGSRASSPTGCSQRNALSLFPTTPLRLQELKDTSNENKVQVIKVVPHNPRSAPESAARIFQSIQEERKRT